jgi:hypothetical protein
VDSHNRHHDHVGVGQDQGGLVGLERHRLQSGGEGVAAMPQPPGRAAQSALIWEQEIVGSNPTVSTTGSISTGQRFVVIRFTRAKPDPTPAGLAPAAAQRSVTP